MENLGTLKLDPSSTERSCNGEQMCFLSKSQVGVAGNLFTLEYNNQKYNFKIIDIWHAPKDFAKKFSWKMCGLSSPEELNTALDKVDGNMIYIHIFYPQPWDKIKDLVIS